MTSAAAPAPLFDDGPLAGTSAIAGTEFEPTELVGPMAAAPELRLPRPSRVRLPIDSAAFAELKARARTDRGFYRAQDKLRRDVSPPGGPPTAAATTAMPGGNAGALAMPMPAAPAAPTGPGGPGGPAPAPPALIHSYAGIPFAGWIPYDCALAVGPSHVLCAVNSSVAIFPKAGGAALRQRSLSSWFSGVVQGATVFDPRLVYDAPADRWVLLATAYDANGSSWFLLSVSQSGDPMAAWYNYALDARLDGNHPTTNWADYPGLAYDANALYLTANMFVWGGGYAYAKLRVVDKSTVYSGARATYQDFVGLRNGDGTLAFTVLPCQRVDGAGTQYLVNSLFPPAGAAARREITLWTVTGTPAAPALTQQTVATDPYAVPPDADQPGGAAPLESGDIRLLTACAQGNSVWTCLTTVQTWDDGTNAAAVYWLQIDAAAGAVQQDAVYGATGRHYLYPALVPDAQGNALLAFARVGTAENAALHVASRRHTDSPNALSSSSLVHPGSSPYTGFDSSGRNRWGDYLGVAADPQEAGLLWAYGGYAAGATTWATWVCSARP